MLLTSSQVSVAISSVTIFLFASALFLAGYALQQQTVRDLRAAIKPQIIRPKPELQTYLPPQFRDDEESTRPGGVSQEIIVDQNRDTNLNGGQIRSKGERRDVVDIASDPRGQNNKLKGGLVLETKTQERDLGSKKATSKEEDAGARSIDDNEQSEDKPEDKPLGRAERRKRIKEQILAEGEGEGFKGYRRRAW